MKAFSVVDLERDINYESAKLYPRWHSPAKPPNPTLQFNRGMLGLPKLEAVLLPKLHAAEAASFFPCPVCTIVRQSNQIINTAY